VSSLRDYVGVFWRRRAVLLAATLIVPLTAGLLSARQQVLHEASAEVLLNRQNLANQLTNIQDLGASSSDPERLAATQAVVARSPTVAERTIARVPAYHDTVRGFLQKSAVVPDPGADLMTFTVINHDQRLARRLVTEYAAQYIVFRRQLDTDSLVTAQKEVQSRLNGLKTSSPLYGQLAVRIQQLETLEALQTANASLVRTPTDTRQVQPRLVRNVMVGLTVGVLIGLGLAMLVETLDTRLRGTDEVERELGVPLLGRLPTAVSQGQVWKHVGSPGFEAVQLLRATLSLAMRHLDAQVLMVTSAVSGEGKTTTVLNLAGAFARTGRTVAVVDFDIHRPQLASRLGGQAAPGLSEVLMGEARLHDALQTVDLSMVTGEDSDRKLRPLYLLALGTPPPFSIDLSTAESIPALLSGLRETADVVLIDTPPAVQVSDALSIASSVDGIVIVARPRQLRRPTLRELRRLLDSSPAPVLGVVETAAESPATYGGYGYGYGRKAASVT